MSTTLPHAIPTGSTPTGSTPSGSTPTWSTVEPRMTNPAYAVPGAMAALLDLGKALDRSGLAVRTRDLVQIRASQINGCGVCLDMHTRQLRHAGEPEEKISTVAVWREAPYFTDAERAALALTEASTRLADRADPVPDEVWEEAGRHYSEEQLAALVIAIAGINAWNRLNAVTKQVGGEWVEQFLPAAA